MRAHHRPHQIFRHQKTRNLFSVEESSDVITLFHGPAQKPDAPPGFSAAHTTMLLVMRRSAPRCRGTKMHPPCRVFKIIRPMRRFKLYVNTLKTLSSSLAYRTTERRPFYNSRGWLRFHPAPARIIINDFSQKCERTLRAPEIVTPPWRGDLRVFSEDESLFAGLLQANRLFSLFQHNDGDSVHGGKPLRTADESLNMRAVRRDDGAELLVVVRYSVRMTCQFTIETSFYKF